METISNLDFERVPSSIDFFISHPLLATISSSKLTFIAVTAVVSVLLYFSLFALIKKKNPVRNIICCLALGLLLILFRNVNISAQQALQPTSATVIAAIIDGKTVDKGLFSKKYYLLTKIEKQLCGVVTNRTTYENPRYAVGATFDYSLYTYINKNTIRMYRFLKPEFKLKPEAGNLQ